MEPRGPRRGHRREICLTQTSGARGRLGRRAESLDGTRRVCPVRSDLSSLGAGITDWEEGCPRQSVEQHAPEGNSTGRVRPAGSFVILLQVRVGRERQSSRGGACILPHTQVSPGKQGREGTGSPEGFAQAEGHQRTGLRNPNTGSDAKVFLSGTGQGCGGVFRQKTTASRQRPALHQRQ
jgi:hypothetical protein